jgi:hypothetical protein
MSRGVAAQVALLQCIWWDGVLVPGTLGPVGHTNASVIGTNRLGENGLGENGLTMNGLGENGLGENGSAKTASATASP